ncbi:uncharacterized mitochondrial protein AtMg00810-like [Lycium barbarum]|uniref:uncharacterized mitochondrial protein AtMg00810-like n=1 Tax=Lycium barbarum TaxID=112863 RepID=UPI00293F205B|nr:uncharacterized mitochondrial protein AtMg00810-like [Lycium barbarum]
MDEFEMSDLGLMHYFLGIEVVQSDDGIFISQKKYIGEILDRFQMRDCNPVNTPTELGLKLHKDPTGKKVDSTLYKQVVGSLMYLTATRPDIMYSVSLNSRYMENPTEMHLSAAKRILRYLQGTRDFGIFYKKNEKSKLLGYTDSNYAGDQDDRKSTTGYASMFGSGAISWSAKKQPIVTLSSTKAEFVAATASIQLSKNPVLHGRSKHIDVKFYFLRDLSNNETIELIYCKSEDQVADIFTKALKMESFMKLRRLLGVYTIKDVN